MQGRAKTEMPWARSQEQKKMAQSMGKDGSGGVGAAIVLLASAALASAIFVREKGWSSGENSRRRHDNARPPVVNRLKNKNEQDEASKGLQLVLDTSSSHEQKHASGAAGLVRTRILALDKKPGIEIKGGNGTPGAVSHGETNEQILCSIGLKDLGNDAISDGFAINEEGLETKNMVQEVIIQLTKEDVTNEISEEQVCVLKQAEVDNDLGVHVDQMEYVRDRCRMVSEEGICSNQKIACTGSSFSEAIASGSHSEFENCDEKEVVFPAEILGMTQEDEAFAGEQEGQTEHIDEQSGTDCKQRDLADEEIVREKCEEIFAMAMPKEEIVCEDIEVITDETNKQVIESLQLKENQPMTQFVVCQQNDHEDDFEENMVTEVEESCGTIDTDTTTIRDDLIAETSEDHDDESKYNNNYYNDENEEGKLINQELEGKISEDKAIKEGKHIKAAGCTMADNTRFTDGKGNLEKATLNKQSTILTRGKVLMWTHLVISSFLCSWFFDTSLLEVSLILFLIVILSKIPNLMGEQ